MRAIAQRVSARVPVRSLTLRSLQMLRATAAASAVFASEWWALRRDPDSPTARAAGRALVRLCTTLGATFIKVGQIASTRGDLLSPVLARELATLRDQVPAFDFDVVRATVEAELGQSLETLYIDFDPLPVAAASVAQVHRARWRATGETVAVKVRRPDIIGRVLLDRTILLFIARALERIVPSLRLVSLHGAIENFCAAVEDQLHLSNEARNNARFTANFATDPDVHFPRLVPQACTDAVLTMEFIDGVREEDLEAAGIDIRHVVTAGLRCVCRMIFLHGFVHADLHPGNMRFLSDGRVVLFDLGLVGTLVDEDRLSAAALLYALATGDGVTVARLFYDSAPHTATVDYGKYEQEICALVEDVRRRGLGNLQVTWEIGRIFDILRRHRIQARSHMTMVNLALMTAEGLGKRLDPNLSLADEALPYLAEAIGAPR
jgi:ubiquinone biosynthesis protein